MGGLLVVVTANWRKREKMSNINNNPIETPTATATAAPIDEESIFSQLKDSIIEHSGGPYLRLKDGESQIVTVIVGRDPNDPEKITPREEQVQSFDKTKMTWKMRLDCYLGDNTSGETKIFHVRAQDKKEVYALLKGGARRFRITRYGSTAQNTKYTFQPIMETYQG